MTLRYIISIHIFRIYFIQNYYSICNGKKISILDEKKMRDFQGEKNLTSWNKYQFYIVPPFNSERISRKHDLHRICKASYSDSWMDKLCKKKYLKAVDKMSTINMLYENNMPQQDLKYKESKKIYKDTNSQNHNISW